MHTCDSLLCYYWCKMAVLGMALARTMCAARLRIMLLLEALQR